jgi:hypothetical protein
MAIWAKAVGKLIAIVFVGSIVEGFLLKDPWVELGNGYHIGAISWGSSCFLTYFATQDPRPPSPWSVHRTDKSFVLDNSETNELREYATEEELRQATRDLHVRPAPGRTMLDQVTGFDRDGRFAIGHSGDGYFLLDTTEDTLEKWPTSDEWSTAVRSRTKLNPGRLRDPKSWLLQYRSAGYWATLGIYGSLGLAWIIVPLARGTKPQPHVDG